MISTTTTAWPHQQYAIDEVPRLIDLGHRRICVTAPTGAGKSFIICCLIEWAVENNWLVALYTNRKLLIEQLRRTLSSRGITYGVRASGHPDERNLQVQISSLPTERARVLNSQKWVVHGHGERVLAIVDEAHLNKSDTAQAILQMHQDHGGVHVGFTATPIDLGHLYDNLVVAGTPSELRRCGALVPAYHFGPDEPDMKNFKQNVKTGEYSEGDIKKAIMTKCIFGRVMEYYERINQERRPTILFGPGVKESIWFAEQFHKEGVRAAHIDGNGIWVDGEYQRASIGERDEILKRVANGEIKVLCNRFVAREGLDIPELSHAILATVFGSLQSYLQSVGRILRACLGKDKATIQDHGGHWHRHGSVNMDRHWELDITENIIHGERVDDFREKKQAEPIMCSECGLIRSSGPVCPQCGHESTKRSRIVIQQDGTLHEHTGDIYKPRRVLMKHNTQKLWESTYYRAKKSRNGMTFRQAEGLFVYENHYWPPRDLPFMPKNNRDWFRKVKDVPREELT